MPTIPVPSWSVSLLEVVEIWLTYLIEKLHCEAKVGFETKVKSGPSKKKTASASWLFQLLSLHIRTFARSALLGTITGRVVGGDSLSRVDLLR